MGRFAGLGGVKTNQGGVYFLSGNYVVDIESLKMIENRDKEPCFIVEAKIVESDNPERKPGTTAAQVIKLTPPHLETKLGSLKHVAGAILDIDDPDGYQETPQVGEDEEDANNRFWDETLELMVSDEQPCKGTRMLLSCVQIETKKGNPFTKHTWTHGE